MLMCAQRFGPGADQNENLPIHGFKSERCKGIVA
jgi:hypothetical protein